MTEKIIEKIIDPMIKSIDFWRTYKGKRIKITLEASLHPFDSVTYFDLRRIIMGKAVEIVEFPTSIVIENGEEITSQTRVGSKKVYADKSIELTESREKFKKRAISLNSISSIEVIK